jgi:hypothetical protein
MEAQIRVKMRTRDEAYIHGRHESIVRSQVRFERLDEESMLTQSIQNAAISSHQSAMKVNSTQIVNFSVTFGSSDGPSY